MTDLTAVILAAGEGTRMNSSIPKVLHKICGIPMLGHVISAAKEAGTSRIIVVVGKNAQAVKQHFQDSDIEFVLQKEQLGTGHALMQARETVKSDGPLMVLCGDMPLITGENLASIVSFHVEQEADATVMTARLDDPTGYGRIIRYGEQVTSIKEEKDASDEEKRISEINSGCYCFNATMVFEALTQVENNNAQGEYYLTDVVQILNTRKRKVLAYENPDPLEIRGVNDRQQLAFAQKVMQQRIIKDHMKRGVSFINPAGVLIDRDVSIGRDTVVYPGTLLEGKTEIGENCTIIGGRIKDSKIGDYVEIVMSQIQDSVIEDGVKIGPYSNIQSGCYIS
jgi:bifunctional UDP-N-acetylglucosamine pyrophosphorylase/glucosamine-1-phosphate N-acetyltransferase